ncbi:patatin-like phospholipase family protein [Fortiea sp. LEGE XX443]|uniref:patatin-like phospholipase family protein n=1 Tax=Fortiea sp. LEGE XX443 TaxID=1828611 RepID=UPI001882D0D8|nr:patatin-like phospholipase family protein [Fortiea sp. LEGE XX443]MBE9004333.1 patatin-like phospholipase family protein [Fortiea sp. LEGE XX443]
MAFRILSLDGGGIRGVVAATILAAIEQQINQPLHEYFDLIAGTSTGAILATAIATGRSSQDIIDLYTQKGSTIFPYRSLFSLQRIPLILKYGISAPKFSDSGLIQVLKENLGETTLFDIPSPRLLITAYDTIEREPIIFKSWRQDKDYSNIPLWEVCVCSASAPTYFPAHKLDKKVNGTVEKSTENTITIDSNASYTENIYNNTQIRIISGTGRGQTRTIKKYRGYAREALLDSPWERIPDNTATYSIKCIYSAIDGGVAANNPSACAVAEALRLGYSVEEISVLSIGTGNRTRIIPFEQAESWGLIQWAQPLIGILFDASSGVHEYITKQIIQDHQILRLQFKLDRELIGQRLSDDIDDVSPENIQNLMEAAKVYIQQPSIQTALQEFLRIN